MQYLGLRVTLLALVLASTRGVADLYIRHEDIPLPPRHARFRSITQLAKMGFDEVLDLTTAVQVFCFLKSTVCPPRNLASSLRRFL